MQQLTEIVDRKTLEFFESNFTNTFSGRKKMCFSSNENLSSYSIYEAVQVESRK